MLQRHRIKSLTLICLLAAVFSVAGLAHARTTLTVHAGAGIRPPLDELGALFEKKTGVKIEYNYKGSGCLLADICLSQRGDVYIPGELFYVKQAQERGFIETSRLVAQMSTVVIVQKGNPKRIMGLKDLTREGLRIGLGDPKAVAAGRGNRNAGQSRHLEAGGAERRHGGPKRRRTRDRRKAEASRRGHRLGRHRVPLPGQCRDPDSAG